MMKSGRTRIWLITGLVLMVGIWGTYHYLQIQKARKLIPLFTGLGPDGRTPWEQIPFNERQRIIHEGQKIWDAMPQSEKARFREWLSGKITARIDSEVHLSKQQQYNIKQIIITAIMYREDSHPEQLSTEARDQQFRNTAEAIGNEIRAELTPSQQEGFDKLRGRLRPVSPGKESN